MSPRSCCLPPLFLLMLPTSALSQTSLTDWRAALLEDGRDGAILLLQDGRTLEGKLIGVTQDSVSLSIDLREPPDRWDSPPAKVLAFPWSDVKKVTCGDPLRNGALTGLLVGTGAGAAFFTWLAMAFDENATNLDLDILFGLTYGTLIVGIPSALGGAMIDAARGGRVREYAVQDRPPAGELSRDRPVPPPSAHRPISAGGFAGMIFPGEDGHKGNVLPVFGARATFMTRRGIFPEFSLGYGESHSEAWMHLNASIGLTAGEYSHLKPYGLVGYNRIWAEYYEKPGAIINYPWEEETQHLFWGGGAFFDVAEGRAALRPEFTWFIGSEGFMALTMGAEYYF